MRILLLVHEDLIPPNDAESLIKQNPKEPFEWKMEFEIKQSLEKQSHSVEIIGIYDDITPLRNAIKDFKPSIVFNLMEEFRGISNFDQHISSYLEIMNIPYTGANPKALMLGRDKSLTKQILNYNDIKVPQFEVIKYNKKYKKNSNLSFPVIVKSLYEEASFAISQASVVNTLEELEERIKFVHEKTNKDVIIEEYIEGRELLVGVIGNSRLEVFPALEVVLGDMKEKYHIQTRQAKFNLDYQKRNSIKQEVVKLEEKLSKELKKLCKKVYSVLEMNGYVRIDLRMNNDNDFYVIEVKPNPDLSSDGELAIAAKAMGVSFDELLNKIIRLGKSWKSFEEVEE